MARSERRARRPGGRRFPETVAPPDEVERVIIVLKPLHLPSEDVSGGRER